MTNQSVWNHKSQCELTALYWKIYWALIFDTNHQLNFLKEENTVPNHSSCRKALIIIMYCDEIFSQDKHCSILFLYPNWNFCNFYKLSTTKIENYDFGKHMLQKQGTTKLPYSHFGKGFYGLELDLMANWKLNLAF